MGKKKSSAVLKLEEQYLSKEFYVISTIGGNKVFKGIVEKIHFPSAGGRPFTNYYQGLEEDTITALLRITEPKNFINGLRWAPIDQLMTEDEYKLICSIRNI